MFLGLGSNAKSPLNPALTKGTTPSKNAVPLVCDAHGCHGKIAMFLPPAEVEPRAAHPRFSQAVLATTRTPFSTYRNLPSNARAAETALLFSKGMVSFAALVGPTGCGKTHLLNCVEASLAAWGHECMLLDDASQLAHDHRRLETIPFLILDNGQDAWSGVRRSHQARMVLHRRMRTGKATLLALGTTHSIRKIRTLLPAGQDWVVSSLTSPRGSERVRVVESMMQAHDLMLAPCLMGFIADHSEGNGHQVDGALNKLKAVGTRWNSPRRIMQACGILDPYWRNTSSYDLRDQVNTNARRLAKARGLDKDEQKLASMLIMRKAFGLGEQDVANYFRRNTGEIYVKCQEALRVLPPDLVAEFTEMWIEEFEKSLSGV